MEGAKKTLKTHLAVQQLQQCTLPGTVRPHQGQPGIQIDPELQILVDPRRVVGIPEADVLHHDDGRWDGAAAREIERDYLIVGDFLGQALGHHLGQGLLLGLGLAGEFRRSVPESGNVILKI